MAAEAGYRLGGVPSLSLGCAPTAAPDRALCPWARLLLLLLLLCGQPFG